GDRAGTGLGGSGGGVGGDGPAGRGADPPSSGTADDLLVSDPDGQVFGDRSLLPAPGEEPAGDEVVALRTATTRTFETDVPGVFVTEQFAAPVNVEAGEGWVPIDPTLE